MLNFLNRPISPHLTVYTPQASSLLSIWHRISGVLLAFCCISLTIILKLTISLILVDFLFSISNIFKYAYILLNILLIYHLFNGIRNILLNFNYLNQLYYFKLSLILLSIYFIIIALKQIII